MLRTTMAKSYIKRTFRPTYGWTQMTPKSVFLDSAWDRSIDIFPGMAMMKTVGENVTLLGAASASTGKIPYGFAALYVGGDGVDEPLEVGINAFATWTMAPDAEAEVLAPAFVDSLNWAAQDVAGTEKLVHAVVDGANRGKLAYAGAAAVGTLSTAPIARLIKVNSASKITLGGLR